TVTITGTGLGAVTAVHFGDFGDSAGSDIHIGSDGSSLTVTTPPAPSGKIRVTVTSGENSIAGPEFTYAPSRAMQSTPPGWIVMARSVSDFAAVDRSTVVSQLDGAQTHVVVGANSSACSSPALSILPHAAPTASFTSYAAFAALLQHGALPSCITTVLHDPEAWKFTPSDEQRHPDRFAREFATLAHHHGLQVIEAPAQNLVLSLGQKPGESRAQAYLRHGLAATAARYSDIAELQVQGDELDHRSYSATVAAFLAQARAANSRTAVQAGLATNPNGRDATPEQMYQAALSAEGQVGGFWLNDAQKWAGCAQCSGPYPSRAVDFLGYLSRG
ncbi:MAG TPA: IPT/TIG domain-containing protein, partial [Mycobacteriales bacterium]|nr:IPT/TIG domain-containing protein [Mycobacteriales bacterium]